ncbi:hypothetical protein GALL_388560 [mine drainage metagenome]|uniref:Uncharacterized protein n=1 Tax=mine drainage metagenome TaxID=410659 RepID=A0A1J5QPH6_9ZZZZ
MRAEYAVVLEIEKTVGIPVPGQRVENRAIIPRRVVMPARNIATLRGPAVKFHFAEQARRSLAVQVTGHAMVDGKIRVLTGSVAGELGKIEIAAVIIQHGCRQQHIRAIFQLPAVGHPALFPAVAGQFPGNLGAVEVAAFLGDDVDDAEKGTIAVDGRAGSGHVLDTVDQFDIEQSVIADISFVVDVVIGRIAVDHQQDAADVVAGAAETATAKGPDALVKGRVEARHAVEDVGQRAVAIGPDVVGRHDGHRGRRIDDLTRHFRCRDHVHGHQLFQRHLDQVRRTGCIPGVGQRLARGQHQGCRQASGDKCRTSRPGSHGRELRCRAVLNLNLMPGARSGLRNDAATGRIESTQDCLHAGSRNGRIS